MRIHIDQNWPERRRFRSSIRTITLPLEEGASYLLSLVLTSVLVAAMTGCADNSRNDTGKDSAKGDSGEILVFAAASLREAMEELGEDFERETGIHVLFNFAGSNDLAQQIMASSRADLFLSANDSWMDTVENAGRVVDGSRRDLLSNSLVVVANTKMRGTMQEPCDILSLTFDYLALGNPEAVPAGKYAKTWLAGIDCSGSNLWQDLKGRVSPGPDVRAALGLVLADPDVIGIVYKTDQRAFSDRTTILYEVGPENGPHIRYAIARIADAPSPEQAQRFYDYLSGNKSRGIFDRHGFTYLTQSS